MNEIKDLTIKQIAKLVKVEDVASSLEYHYPHLKLPKGFAKSMLKRFTTAPWKKPKDLKERLEVYGSNTNWGDEIDCFYGIHTIILDTMESWGKPKSWSLSFRPWNELINMKVYDGTFEHYALDDIIAHFIYEITWYGPEKTMRKTGKRLLNSVKKIKKDHEKGKGI